MNLRGQPRIWGWKVHDKPKPGDPQGNGQIESKVKKLVRGTRCNLRQAGFSTFSWPWAAKHFAQLTCLLQGKKGDMTPFERRFGYKFGGQLVPFGVLVEFIPHHTSKVLTALKTKMGPHTIQGIFLGYHENSLGLTGDSVVLP